MVLDHLLGIVLADLVLLMLDVYVFGAAGVRTVRVVDDVFLVTDDPEKAREAWQAVKRFCQACGLRLNEAKSGSVCLGGREPSRTARRPAALGVAAPATG